MATSSGPSAGSAPVPGTEEEPKQDQPLSKKKQKRLQKLGGAEGIAERWVQKKKEYKERQREKKRKIREGKEREWQALTPEEQEQRRKEANELWLKREEARKAHAAKIEEAIANPLTRVQVVIDLDFEAQMDDRAIKSMVQQVSLSHSLLRKAGLPCWLTLVGIKKATEGGKIHHLLSSRNKFDEWHLTLRHDPIQEAFKRGSADHSKVVYLSGDSPNVIDTLELDTYYVVGGIVDRNRFKGLSLNRAEKYGFRHGRLPLDAFLEANKEKANICKTLTTNHVVEILGHYAQNKCWDAAFNSVLPTRRIDQAQGGRRRKKARKANEGEEEEEVDEEEEEDEVSGPCQKDQLAGQGEEIGRDET